MGHLRLRLVELLKERGVTQKQLAEGTGLAESTISRYVRNHAVSYDREVVDAICHYFNIDDVGVIFTFDPPKEKSGKRSGRGR
jgi:transcriptional regulator with XRE-family HTH domain